MPCKEETATVRNIAQCVQSIIASERQLLLLLPDQVWEALHRGDLSIRMRSLSRLSLEDEEKKKHSILKGQFRHHCDLVTPKWTDPNPACPLEFPINVRRQHIHKTIHVSKQEMKTVRGVIKIWANAFLSKRI